MNGQVGTTSASSRRHLGRRKGGSRRRIAGFAEYDAGMPPPLRAQLLRMRSHAHGDHAAIASAPADAGGSAVSSAMNAEPINDLRRVAASISLERCVHTL